MDYGYIFQTICENLPHEPQEGRIWTPDEEEILCPNKEAAYAICDFLGAMAGEPQIATCGYYDPEYDAKHGQTDSRTGFWYVSMW